MQNHEYLLIRHYENVRSGTVYQLPETSTVRLAAPTDSKCREEYGYNLYKTRQMTIEDVNLGIRIADRDHYYGCTDITLINTHEPAKIKPFMAEEDYLKEIKAAWELNGALPFYLRRVVKTTEGNRDGMEKFPHEELKDLFHINGNDFHEIELSEFTVIPKY